MAHFHGNFLQFQNCGLTRLPSLDPPGSCEGISLSQMKHFWYNTVQASNESLTCVSRCWVDMIQLITQLQMGKNSGLYSVSDFMPNDTKLIGSSLKVNESLLKHWAVCYILLFNAIKPLMSTEPC